MIFEHCRATGAFEAVQSLSDLSNMRLQNDDVKISTFDGTKVSYQQAKFLRKWFWKDFSSQNCRILFSNSLCWLCMTKRLFETMVNRAYEVAQDPSDLFNIRLQNDDVQDFDTRWDQALLSASELPAETVLEDLHRSKLQYSAQSHTVGYD